VPAVLDVTRFFGEHMPHAELRAGEWALRYLANGTLHTDQKYVYDIFAIIIHKGQSANSGHYMALVRLEANRWFLFNDETTCPFNPLKTPAASGTLSIL
jgi:uncharacterized UBP type Zn finger protein